MSLIIGASTDSATPKFPKALSEPEVDLPHPASAPELQPALSDAQIEALLAHDSPLVRTFAIEQISQRDSDSLLSALSARVNDDDRLVSIEAISVLEAKQYAPAAEAIETCFGRATGDLAAVCASALGRLAPERLLGAVKERGRLDDEGFAAAATSIAILGNEDSAAYLAKALNRAGAINVERRGALYGAALLSGDATLAGRVVGLAIDDSQKEEPDQHSFPSRAAFAVLAGLATQYSRQETGLEIFDHAREMLEQEVLPSLPEAEQATLREGMKSKDPAKVLAALAPLLATEGDGASSEEDRKDLEEEMGSMPRRRKGLLQALVQRAETIGKLDLKAAAIFVASAAQASMIVLAHDLNEASSSALVALSKALEAEVSAQDLATMAEPDLVKLFEAKSARDMRRIVTCLVREGFRRGHTLERFAKAVFMADHGVALMNAAAEVDEPHVHSAVVRAAGKAGASAEAAVVDMLEDRESEERSLPLVLRLAEEIRSERVALTLGRRFYALRNINRSLLARAILRTGDARLLPLLKSRAFEDEAEEVAWVVLALVHSVEIDDELGAAIERTLVDRGGEDQQMQLRLPLLCTVCGERNSYSFARAYVDVEAKDQFGDPALVGEIKCKACHSLDTLEPTEQAARILTGHMLEFLQAAQTGAMGPPPLVTPAQTDLNGKKMGLARALRELGEEIGRSPEAIRPRLHRARVGLILERSGIAEDLEVVYAADPDSTEARALQATLLMRQGKEEEAMQRCAEAVRLLKADTPARLYDADGPERLLQTVEDYMVELEVSQAQPPEDIDLTEARARRDVREFEMMAKRQAQMEAMERAQQPEAEVHDLSETEQAPAVQRKVGRNDPCPCGSGKKYKKCHGSAR